MRRKHRPSHATVVAYLALFVALGGTTYAAATIGPDDIKNDAVRTNHVKNGEVQNGDLGANSVGTGKVIDGSLVKKDFKVGQLPPGAISLNRQFASDDSDHEVTRLKGLRIVVHCRPAEGPYASIRVGTTGGQGFFAWGTQAANLALSRASPAGTYISATGTNSAELNVVAAAIVAGKPIEWTRFDLSVRRGSACSFHGMVTRSAVPHVTGVRGRGASRAGRRSAG